MEQKPLLVNYLSSSDFTHGYLLTSEKSEEAKKEITSLFHPIVPKEARMHQIVCLFNKLNSETKSKIS